MLCPSHSHVKFPCEKSKSKKRASQEDPASSHKYVCFSVIINYFSDLAISLKIWII